MGKVLRKRTALRDGVRILFMGVGLYQWIVFAAGGFAEGMMVISGGMFMMMAATNFCSQCPLLSAVKSLVSSKKNTVIPTEKI
jgi:hypothetical protein